MTDPTICADGIAKILEACEDREKADRTIKKPFLISISTAGIQTPEKPRALPLLYLTFYYWLLAEPHAEKVALEATIRDHMGLEEDQRAIAGYILVRPSILTDGNAKCIVYVRVGSPESPPVGYYVDRQVIGEWIFKTLVKDKGAERRWKYKEGIVTY